jgi:hypothetical protein
MTQTIPITLLLPGQLLDNYNKFCSLPCRKTNVAVCEESSKQTKQSNPLKIRKAPPVQMKIQAMEGSFHEDHDWVNNTGVVVLERDGLVTCEEAVKKYACTTMMT